MTSLDELKLFLSFFLGALPVLIACVVAIIVILTQGRRLSGAASWALLGFGLALALCFAMPLGQVVLQTWIVRGAHSLKESSWMFSVFGLASSTLHAVVLILLLVAVFAGRTPVSVPPPLPRG